MKRPGVWPWLALAVLSTTACVVGRIPPGSLDPPTEVRVPGFVPGTDGFAFPNEIRARHPGVPDLYANYCFVLARGLRQFFVHARFEPGWPRLDHAGYVARVREIAARPPWAPPQAAAERVVIPGYAHLREFSGAQEAAVKEGLGGRLWTLVHWSNWRVAFPVTASHQAGVAREAMDELAQGRLVQLLVTNWPTPELNHTVVAFGARGTTAGVDFEVWDPNDPEAAGILTFDAHRGHFWAARLHDTRPGPIRAFRMHHSPWL